MTSPVVLISDDDPLVVAALLRNARQAGVTCISDTTSGVLELARQHRPAVIILDINQHEDGRDLLARLKQDPLTRDAKVIVLTGVEDPYTRHVCLGLGAESYEVKPVDPFFMHRVARLIARSGEPPP